MHVIFVPLILWSALVAVAYVPIAEGGLAALAPYNVALVVFLVYSIYYIWLDLSAGLTWTLFMGK